MDSKGEFLVVCLTLVSLVNVSKAVQCYVCDNIINVNSNCKDTFDSLAVGVGQKDCISGCAKTKYDVNNVQYVIRGCASATVTSDDCVSGSYDGNSADICSCSLPLCNTATPMKFSVAGLIVVCVLTLMHRMIL